MTSQVPPAGVPLRLRGRVLAQGRPAVMAVVNRTPDSFYAAARAADDDAAMAAVVRAHRDGADLVDIGGVRAGRGAEVVLEAGADLVNDTWAGHDPRLVEVAARYGAGIVCSHTGGLPPRTDPWHPEYPLDEDEVARGTPLHDGVVLDVLATLEAAAARAVAAGVEPGSVLVDPTHDFGKTTWHSLHLTRSTPRLVALGYPVLMALSRKDFVGESLGLPVDERLEGTLAATAVAAWSGASVFRAHDVRATRRTLEMVAVLRGDLPPARAVRGLV